MALRCVRYSSVGAKATGQLTQSLRGLLSEPGQQSGQNLESKEDGGIEVHATSSTQRNVNVIKVYKL